jgi:hypothetical protein
MVPVVGLVQLRDTQTLPRLCDLRCKIRRRQIHTDVDCAGSSISSDARIRDRQAGTAGFGSTELEVAEFQITEFEIAKFQIAELEVPNSRSPNSRSPNSRSRCIEGIDLTGLGEVIAGDPCRLTQQTAADTDLPQSLIRSDQCPIVDSGEMISEICVGFVVSR